MGNITASCHDALIDYGGRWYDATGTDVRFTNEPGSNATLRFRGSAVYAYGYSEDDTTDISCTIDKNPCNPDPALSNASSTQPFVNIQNLDSERFHELTITLKSGSLNLTRLEWPDPSPSLVLESRITGIFSGNWTNYSSLTDQPANGTNNTGSSVTFEFIGSGIAVRGFTGPEVGAFSATLDDQTSENFNASAPSEHWAVLYRSYALEQKKHTLTLTNQGRNLRVGQAEVFVAQRSGSQPSTSGDPPSPTATETPKPHSGSLSTGRSVGLAVGVLALVGLLALGLLFWYRKRRASQRAHEQNQVTYARICSKCRQDITGDYRLECVQPNCPADIDLHPECKDWNTPEHHDHEVHEVPNKS